MSFIIFNDIKASEIEMNEKDFEKVFSDNEFIQKLLSFKTGEQVTKALKEKGIDLKDGELDKIASVLVRAIESGKKISNDDAVKVSGGVAKGIASNSVNKISEGANLFAQGCHEIATQTGEQISDQTKKSYLRLYKNFIDARENLNSSVNQGRNWLANKIATDK